MNMYAYKEVLVRKDTPKLRFLLPFLALLYAGVGGFIVPNVDIAVGHVIMATLAAVSVAVTILAFLRYDEAHHSSSYHLSIFKATVAVIMYLIGVIVLHAIWIMDKEKDTTLLSMAETVLIAIVAAALLMVSKKLRRR